MTSKRTLTGKCLCGAVSMAVTANGDEVGTCHCDMCRRWCSGPFFEVTCEDVTFEGEDNITKYRSSEWAERGFCNKCGTNLFYHIIDSEQFQVSIGLMDDQSDLHLSLQVFIDSKPSFYALANQTETMTAAEIFAKYAPPPD
ncbi:GFA family protein [Yoonia sp. F2084L]|uniref:GFA family protein n=1 Tax=Yoonia sp. F2084L TaxID=2926419 RepID=UPI001FF562B9|nr:GFA family protein [Yoonia sp. F2084L]MCK0097427.1 GFA family protein [Yoonia sp. F2084L]